LCTKTGTPCLLPQEWPGFSDEEFLRILTEDDAEAVAFLADDEAKKRRFQKTREEIVSDLVGHCPRWCARSLLWRP
jgi:hypothetical protein